jgi:hypothetical protein
MALYVDKDGDPRATTIGPISIRFDANDGSEVRIRVPAVSLAYVLLAWEGRKLLLDPAWANGDSAEIIVKRIRWQDLPWKLTTQGWVRGPLRVWSPGIIGEWRATFNSNILEGWFKTAEEAQEAAMLHAMRER